VPEPGAAFSKSLLDEIKSRGADAYPAFGTDTLISIQSLGPYGHSACDTYAEDVHPSLVEIEQVRIEKRREYVLHDNQQPDPSHQTAAPKHQQIPIEPHWTATFSV
jgi:hypothetical protein